MAALHEPKPRFHIAPPQGWINDPNGPLYYKGYYHMFYQYVETGCSWSWGLLWGHAVSKDLVTWQHMPPALAPSFGGFDGDGCFSGCATVDEDGVPTILYTGVRLRSSDTCGPLPPPECDLGTACIETQCIAFGDPADPKLTYWTKEEVPFLSLPPPNMNLTAWRDPYVIGRPGVDGQDCWTVMVGAGVKERGGTALVYKSTSLRGGSWSYVGELCRGCGDTGVIWECPVMLHLPRLPPHLPPLLSPMGAPTAARGQLRVQSPLAAPRPASAAAASRLSPFLNADAATGAAVVKAAKEEHPQEPQLSPRKQPEPLPLELLILPSPASPRPPIRPRPASAAAAEGEAQAPWEVLGAHALADGLPDAAGQTAAALLSPRRHVVQMLPQTPLSPLRSPSHWNLPALTALPHAPSPPAPRPPTARTTATSPTAGPAPPPAPSAAAAPATISPAGGGSWSSSAASNPAHTPAAAERPRRTPPASPRVLQLLPGSSGAGVSRTLTHGSPMSPRPAARRASAAAGVSALLSAVASPVRPRAAAAPTALLAPSPPPIKPLPAGGAAADAGFAASASCSWQQYQTFFCVCPDDCNSMAVYYLGAYDNGGTAFKLDEALGPFPLDLGDIFYAPNTLMDLQGRAVLWGWLQEKPRKVGTYDYAGCLSMPRMLYLEVNDQAAVSKDGSDNSSLATPPVYLVQRPPPEIAKLRVPGSEWLAEGILLEPGSTLPVPLAPGAGDYLEINISMSPLPQPLEPLPEDGGAASGGEYDSPVRSPTRAAAAGQAGRDRVASRCSGVLLHSWCSGAEGSAALLYHWDSGVLEVVFEAMDPATLTFSLAAHGVRRVGGRLQRPPAPGNPLALRVFLDFSCLEVFTGNGEVLTARVYRGSAAAATATASSHHHHHHHPHHHYQHQHLASPGSTPRTATPLYGAGGAAASGVELVSFGCATEFVSVGAYEVGTIWAEEV